MNAKSKADFINAVAAGTVIPCPKCGTSNVSDVKFCTACGAELNVPQEKQNSTPAFAPVKEPIVTAETVESNDVFAQGLPEWSIEPPQVMVRRRH